MDEKDIRILFIGANPANTFRLRMDLEHRAIERVISNSKMGERIQLITKLALPSDELVSAIQNTKPTIVHFCTHGEEDGIILEHESGEGKLVSPEMLSKMFLGLSERVPCVVLNSCASFGLAERLVSESQVACVVGLSSVIVDADAIEFASRFYKFLCDGEIIQATMQLTWSSLAGYGMENANLIQCLFAPDIDPQRFSLKEMTVLRAVAREPTSTPAVLSGAGTMPPLLPPNLSDNRAKGDDSRLLFPEQWRFNEDLTSEVPSALFQTLYGLIKRIAKSAKDEWKIVELFQARFGSSESSDLSFAYRDLDNAMTPLITNGALFIEYFWRGICDAKQAGAAVPDVAYLNALFLENQFPYELAPPLLRRTDTLTTTTRGHELSASQPASSSPPPRVYSPAGAAPVNSASDLDRLQDVMASASVALSASDGSIPDDLLDDDAPHLVDNAPPAPPNTAVADSEVLFIVREYANPDTSPEFEAQFPQVLLAHRRWDDFKFKITYHATLFTTPDTGYDLGDVKIFQPNGVIHDNTLTERFTHLDATFCSLGSVSWYQQLLKHIELAAVILRHLRDVTMLESDERLGIINTQVFLRSVMRAGARERTWHELKHSVNPLREAMGLPPLQAVIDDSEVPSTLLPDLSLIVDEPHPTEEGPPLNWYDAPMESEPLAQGAAPAGLPEPPPMSPTAEASASAASSRDGQPVSTDAPSAPYSPSPEASPPDPSAEPPPPEPQPTHESYTLSISATGARLLAGVDVKEEGKPLWLSTEGIDWSREHFLDHQGKPCKLQTALGLLPLKWDRGTTRRFGEKLAALVFGDRPGPAVVAAWTVQPGARRRVVLKLDEANLGVPWEYLVIDGGFIAERNISIVRHVESSVDAQPTLLGKPSRVLYVYANPGTENASLYDPNPHNTRLNLHLSERGILCQTLGNIQPKTLKRMLGLPDGDVFHFVGHGKPGGKSTDAALYLHRDDEQPGDHPIDAETIAQWIRYYPRRLVVLGACHGATVTDARPNGSIGWRIVHETGTPVVAMQMAVSQEFSDAFTLDFYGRLHDVGYDIEAAVFLARRIEHSKRHAFGIPVLLADARVLSAVPTLARAAESREWANFHELVVRVVWAPAEQAAQTWRDTALAKPELRNLYADAIKKDAEKSDDSTLYRCAPEEPAELEDALAAVRKGIHDKSILKDLPQLPSPPPPPPAVVTHRRIDVEGDLPLCMRINDRLTQALDDIKKQLSIGPEIVPRILGELLAGRHVLLTGPVGTGKTSLAQAIARALGYTAQIETASADWTRFEILGGFWPTPAGGQLGFTFRPGVFYEAVRSNWSVVSEHEDTVKWRHVRRSDGPGGVWLILDELNRADMDRALGGVFTALETRKLRVPAATADGGSTEIPIPQDFRVIATINTADRHFLFRLSDALKRRFAFVDVPVASDWTREWEVLTDGTEPPPEDGTYVDLRRFVGLVRVLHALGSALFLAALRFLQMSAPLSAGDDTYVWRLTQAITGSILPNLEDLRDAALKVLQTWAAAPDPVRLAQTLVDVLPEPDSHHADLQRRLASIPAAHEPTDAPADLQFTTKEAFATWIANRVARPEGAAPLTELVATFRDLRRDDTDA
jgi:MoxR-like ATPase